jgi:hypothetical protein
VAAKLVILGLIAASIASAGTGPPPGPLPGVALGSEPLLFVERTVAFFAAWMLVLMIIMQALRGHLPSEISGRGVKYADVGGAEAAKAGTEDAVQRLASEVERLRWELTTFERTRG